MFVFILALVAIAIVYWFFVAVKHPKGFPNGPRFTLPVIGDSLAIGKDLAPGLDKLREKYGEVMGLFVGPFRTVVISDFDLIQEAGANPLFQNRQDFPAASYLRGGRVKTDNGTSLPGILFGIGSTGAEQRRYILHTLRDLGFGKGTMEDLISDEVKELCSHFEKENSMPIDVRFGFQVSVLNSLWRIISNETLEYDDPKILKLIALMDSFMKELGNPVKLICFMYSPILEFVKATKIVDGPEALIKLRTFLEDVVSDHESTFQDDCMRDFTDHYLNEIKIRSNRDENSSFKGADGRLNLINSLIDLFVAGSETTSNTLNWAMLYMILNPEVQSKVQEELDGVTGRGRNPAIMDRESTPYTEAVIHELQRCANIGPLSVIHRAAADGYLAGKYFIPKDTDIVHNIGHVMQNPEYFPNPKLFDPTRHLNEDGKFVAHPKVIPFGVGKRRCLGETLARMSLYLFFTGIMSNFTVTKASEDDNLTLEPIYGLTSSPQPYKLKFIPRR